MVPPPQSCHRQRGRLTPTWAPQGAIRCRIAIIAMSRGQTPRPRHDGPLRTGGGLAQVKRRGGCRADSCDRAATGGTPRIDDASEPWRVALQAGPEALTPSGRADEAQRWQARRAETVLAATVGRPARCSRRLGRQRKASWGHSRSTAAAPPVSRSETTDRPSALSYPTPAPGPRERSRGAVDRASRRLARAAATPCRVRCGCGGARARRRPFGTAFSEALSTFPLTRRGAGP